LDLVREGLKLEPCALGLPAICTLLEGLRSG